MLNFTNKVLRYIRWRWSWMHDKQQFFYNYIVFHFMAVLRVFRIPFVYCRYKDILKYHNKYQGKRCFVVATGPSLNVKDVEKLDGEFTIGVNQIYKMYNQTSWRPTFYLAGDYKAGKDFFQRLSLRNLAKVTVFFSHPIREYVDSSQVVYIPVCWLDHWYKGLKTKSWHYSKNLLWGHYDAMTVTNFAINLADYMGFETIYLLGVDMNFDNKKKHFYETVKLTETDDVFDINLNMQNKDAYDMKMGYEFYKKVLNKKKIRIYNATRGGKLEVFPRVDLDSILKINN